MVKKTIFLHLKKRLKLFCIINVFFMIPFSSFGTNSIISIYKQLLLNAL